MKAAVYTRYGPPEVVTIAERPIPRPAPGQVLVKVYAATVNRTDCGFRSAVYVISRLFSGLFRPKFQVLGNEFAGVVEAVGDAGSPYQPGDRVFGYNDTSFGAHAEYMLMPANGAMALIPEGLSFAQAAPICEGAHYALCDIRAAKVSAGQRVMVYGASGAIGSAAVQLLHHFGAAITAVCSTAQVQLIQSLGADEVVDYTTQDFTATPQHFDFIFDAVGKSSFAQCKNMLTPKGIYISTELGKRSANVRLALTTPLMGGKKVLFPIPTISQQDVLFLRDLVANGQFKPLIDRSYPLDAIVEAYIYVETGQKIGNVIIEVNGE